MLTKNLLKLRLYKEFTYKLAIIGMLGGSPAALALTADDVLNKMNVDQRSGYFSGVIAGLAQSRWIVDKPDDTGMQCIFDWYYSNSLEKHKKIHEWFELNLDKPAGALLYVLVKKECGAIK